MELISERALKIIAAHTAALNEFNRLLKIQNKGKDNIKEAWVRGAQLAQHTIWCDRIAWERARRNKWVETKVTSKEGERPAYLYDLNSIDPKFLIK